MKFPLSRRQLTIGRQIAAGFALLILLLAWEGSAAQWALSRAAALRQQYADSVGQTRSAGQIESAAAALRLDAESYYAERQPAQLERYSADQAILARLFRSSPSPTHSDTLQQELARLKAAFAEYDQSFQKAAALSSTHGLARPGWALASWPTKCADWPGKARKRRSTPPSNWPVRRPISIGS